VIEGRFQEATGLPVVTGYFWLVDHDARLEVVLVVDITVPRTVLSTSDLRALGNVHRAISAWVVDDEPAPRAILSLKHDDGQVSGFLLECAVTDADYSRLGRDVLERTVMVYDPRGGNLLLDLLEPDL
jgi:hypothetical protein